ncbi:tRNA modification GTPase TrmE [Fomitopsis serialis]|uniref:tRNA modification GTPase TrmE n=1 Tax=Fomitopsis serialis TaxID=139415 RepID=UPI0020089459|nr:tRNA modification GTPase TrmE [Neoantrodia serialis]KAH9918164.1 tRNA modification GTPase TrmE [Neoantrodia serialis]
MLRCRLSAASHVLRNGSTLLTKEWLIIRAPAKHAGTARYHGTSVRSNPQHEAVASRGFRAHEGQLSLSDNQRRTIYALSTPPGKGGVAVIRISGPDALLVWRAVVNRGARKDGPRNDDPAPWQMYRCKVTHPVSGEVLDDGLAVYFKAPKSFTTEDVVELHIHSGRAVVSSVLSALSCIPACRLAEAGEFTRRAFKGGRLDLTQVEGLNDLINAETESQRKAALIAAGGIARNHFEKLRKDIIQCLALVEALIDFGEGEDIEEGVFQQARERARDIAQSIREQLSDNRRGEILRSGIRLAIFGPPNAGKSSLLNFLAQREAAIVTSVPGTTRDILELSLDIGGLPVIVADTAGIRQTDDLVESIGVERARNLVESTDVSLCVLSLPDVAEGSTNSPVIPPSVASLIAPDTYVLLNKSDVADIAPNRVSAILDALGTSRGWVVSLATGKGTQDFLDGFAQALQERYDVHQEQNTDVRPLITHARHRVNLEHALQFLDAFLGYDAEDVVLAAEELRYAAQAIGKISGVIDVEDILDAVFRDFCIGK